MIMLAKLTFADHPVAVLGAASHLVLQLAVEFRQSLSDDVCVSRSVVATNENHLADFKFVRLHDTTPRQN